MNRANGAAAAVTAIVAVAQANEPEVFCSSCPFAGCPDCAYQVACEACGDETTDPTICDHHALCGSCAEDGCRRCEGGSRYEARLGI